MCGHVWRCNKGIRYTRWLKKCPTGWNAIPRQPTVIFLPKNSAFTEEILTVGWYIFIFSRVFIEYFIPYFKITQKKWRVTCNVQRSTSLNSFFLQTRSKCPSHLPHKLDVFLWRCSMAFLIHSYGSGWHINFKTFFSPSVFFGLGWSVLQCSSLTPLGRDNQVLMSRKFGGHSVFAKKSLQLVEIQSWANFAVWAGAPSCWKMKPDGRIDLHSSISLASRAQRNV